MWNAAVPIRKIRESYFAEFNDQTKTPRPKYVSLRTWDLVQAEKTYSRLRNRYDLGLFDPWQSAVTLPAVVDTFLAARSSMWREKTRVGYTSILSLLCGYLGAIDVSTITDDDITGFLDSRPLGQVSRETCQGL